MLRSVPQMPTASTRTTTSPDLCEGSSESLSSIRPGSVRRAAFRSPPYADCHADQSGASYRTSPLFLRHQQELAGGGAALEQPVGLVGPCQRKAGMDPDVEIAVCHHRHHG